MGDLIKNYKISKVFTDNTNVISSLDFDASGEYLVTCSSDESMRLYSIRDGVQNKHAYSKKYGCSIARFTHKASTVLHTSTKEDHTIRYLSFHDNKYIRYFKGHTGQVCSLVMSPLEDLFLSGSKDSSVRLWDLRKSEAVGVVSIPSNGSSDPCVAYDPTGLVFAVASHSRSIRLYDARKYSTVSFINVGTV